jgi:hypothetical protein
MKGGNEQRDENLIDQHTGAESEAGTREPTAMQAHARERRHDDER